MCSPSKLPTGIFVALLSLCSMRAAPADHPKEGEVLIGGVQIESILQKLEARMEHGVGAEQLAEYSRHFDLLDRDRDGRHSKVEYIENGNYLDPLARSGIFGAADNDRDGFVTKAEYLLNRIITDEARALVQAMDDDQDGAIQRAEFVAHTSEKLADASLAGMVFGALDTDGNGETRVPEYLPVWGRWARSGRRSPEERLANESADLIERVTHGYADNDGVKIHYVTIGEGAPIVMIHGFPDFWYTWRKQMGPLSAAGFQVVAIDQRGYNKSDKPTGVDQYAMNLLVEDVAAVLKALGKERAIICGHDWGGAVAWTFAMTKPDLTEKLIILNLPHPRGLARELATNPEQQKNSAYARRFQEEGAHKKLTAQGLAGWVKDPGARARYVEAFERSDFEAMLNYYKRNYPREPYEKPAGPVVKVRCPVLMIHGLEDKALLAPALNDSWNWLEEDLTLVTIPGAGHFVQQDAADLVTRSMRAWLRR